MIRNYLDYIDDIINSIDEISEFIKGMDFETFKTDKKTIKAIIRDLEIIGEASTKISADIQNKYLNIPWKRMIGMRNKLIHEYFGVDLEIVWVVCTEEIPPLKPFFIELLNALS